MKYLVPIVFAALAGVGALLGRLDFMLLFLVAAVAAAAIIAGRDMRQRESLLDTDEMNPESRMLLRPLQRLCDQIEDVVQASSSASVRVIGQEALTESRRIFDQAVRMVRIRSEMKSTLKGRYEAEKEIVRIEEQMEQAQGQQERDVLDTALAARRLEQTHYGELDKTVARVDAALRQAEAALSEIRARLAIAANEELQVSETSDELRESMSRLKALSSSFEEAEEMLRGRLS